MAAHAFSAQAVSHLPAVYRWAFHLCQDRDEAEDLVQETYVKALGAAHTFDPARGQIRPWLFTITYNQFLHGRREKRRQKQATVLPREAVIPINPCEELAVREETNLILAAVNRLPASQRAIVTLWAMEEMKYREIATVLGLPLGTVMSRLHRARERLSRDLERTDQGPGRSCFPVSSCTQPELSASGSAALRNK